MSGSYDLELQRLDAAVEALDGCSHVQTPFEDVAIALHGGVICAACYRRAVRLLELRDVYEAGEQPEG